MRIDKLGAWPSIAHMYYRVQTIRSPELYKICNIVHPIWGVRVSLRETGNCWKITKISRMMCGCEFLSIFHCSRRWGSWFLLLFLLDSPEKEKLFPTVKKEKDRLLLESHISQAVEGLPQCSPRLWQSLHATVSAMIQMVPPLMGSPSVSSKAPSTSRNDSLTVLVREAIL